MCACFLVFHPCIAISVVQRPYLLCLSHYKARRLSTLTNTICHLSEPARSSLDQGLELNRLPKISVCISVCIFNPSFVCNFHLFIPIRFFALSQLFYSLSLLPPSPSPSLFYQFFIISLSMFSSRII